MTIGRKLWGMSRRHQSTPLWWKVDGKTCIGAWQAVGAPSLVDSYFDLSGNNNNLSVMDTPSWNAVDGWSGISSPFRLSSANKSTTEDCTVIARISGAIATSTIIVWDTNHSIANISTNARLQFLKKGEFYRVYVGASGVACLAQWDCYWEGSYAGSTPVGASYVNGHGLRIGGSSSASWRGNIQAVAYYFDTLTASQISDLTDRMNAL